MSEKNLAVVILAAGRGTRMRSRQAKVLHKLAGRSMLGHVAAVAASLSPKRLLVIAPPEAAPFAEAAPDAEIIVQDPPRGTGDAVLRARAALGKFRGDLLILCGDAPLIEKKTLSRLLRALRGGGKIEHHDLAVLGMRVDPPNAYGRLITDAAGRLSAVVEAADATAAQKRITLCNSGVLAARAPTLFGVLDSLSTDNAQGEFYLPDAVGLIAGRGGRVIAVEGAAAELMGVNTRAELAAAESVMQGCLRAEAMRRGVTLIDPATVWFSYDTKLAADVTVGPNVVFEPGVTVGEGAEIRAFCHMAGVRVAAGAAVGPFARLRPGVMIGREAHIGNFVEIKNTHVEAGAKINHLSYIGDARVGKAANIGAGTITCNYDGLRKHRTDIGPGAFIGSNTSLVAPVKLGAGAVTGAGSVITDNVDSNSLALTRPPLTQKPGWKNRVPANKPGGRTARKTKAAKTTKPAKPAGR